MTRLSWPGYPIEESQIVTGLSSRTLAVERGDAIMARASVIARTIGTVIHVNATVIVGPSIDTDTVETTQRVDARATVLTRIRHLALVHVIHTVPT